jgi:hypothetical protein
MQSALVLDSTVVVGVIIFVSTLAVMQLTPMIASNLLDPGSWSGALSVHVVGGVLAAVTIAVVSSLFFPLKWWWRKRELRELIQRRVEFILVYNPHSGASKPITFLDDGPIAAPGRNQNEDTWRIKRGCLEFLTDDGKVYSRYRFDKTRGQLASTNDADIRSLFNQYLFPQY